MSNNQTVTTVVIDMSKVHPSWLCGDIKDFESWFGRMARKRGFIQIPEEGAGMDIGQLAWEARKTRVTLFGQRTLRDGEVKVFRVDPRVGSDCLHHIEVSGGTAFVVQAMAKALEGWLNTAVTDFNGGIYNDVFQGHGRPTKFLTITRDMWRVLDYKEEVVHTTKDEEGNEVVEYHMEQVFLDYLLDLYCRETKAHGNIWVCNDRGVIGVASDDPSATLRMVLRINEFFKGAPKEMEAMEKAKESKPVCNRNKPKKVEEEKVEDEKFKGDKHFYDPNNPYTVLRTHGYGPQFAR